MSIIKTTVDTTGETPLATSMNRGIVIGAAESAIGIAFIATHAPAEIIAASLGLQTFIGFVAWGVYDRFVKTRIPAA